MVPDGQKVWTYGMDGAKTISLQLCRGIINNLHVYVYQGQLNHCSKFNTVSTTFKAMAMTQFKHIYTRCVLEIV